MPLNKNFRFSAKNLQDYADCPRRFELKYLLKQSWPAEISPPVQEVEEKIDDGRLFHKTVNQYLSGVPGKIIVQSLKNSQLATWFKKFLDFFEESRIYPFSSELKTITSLENYQLVAVFDLIGITAENTPVIIDWKTSFRPPRKSYYQDRIQTSLYPLVADNSLKNIFRVASLHGFPITLKYWFPKFPEKSIVFVKNQDEIKKDAERITNIIKQIEDTPEGSFVKTDHLKRCDYCEFRSLCRRGISAGNILHQDEDIDLDQILGDLTLENIEEISL